MEEYPVIRMVDSHTFGIINIQDLLFETLIKEEIYACYIVDVRTDTVVKHPDVI